MDIEYVPAVFEVLSKIGIEITPGLREDELNRIEASLSFRFPPDLRSLLREGLPVAERFPDWRDGSLEELRWLLAGPVDGIVFDVEKNGYWRSQWGHRPSKLEEAIAVARRQVSKAPVLVPIFGHRYIPTEPSEEGNPVFSVSQTDVVVYGNDLADFFATEFRAPRPAWSRSMPRPIMFWTNFTES
jgi:hypothetical protein